MAPSIASKIHINIGLLLIIGVNLVSSGEYSGVLARLYKKAAQQDRPLILVLDNAHHGKPKSEVKPHNHNLANFKSNKELAPLVYLYQLGQAQKKKQLAEKPLKYSKSLRVYRDDYRSNSRYRTRDRRDKQQVKDVRYRVQDLDRRGRSDEDILSSPILKNLLRITNNLLREKADTCDGAVSANCEESKEKPQNVQSWGCDEEEKDQCTKTVEQEEGISTKGELYGSEQVGNKCPRC